MPFSPSQLNAITYFQERYDIIVDHPLVADRRIRLSDSTDGVVRTCRFCNRTTPKTTFRSTAHAVPELLGNKSLVSMNECDQCNMFLANQYEDHLAKWFGPMRTISQIAGKSGVPTYKDKDIDQGGRVRIEMGDEGLHFTIVDADLFSQLSKYGPIAFKLPVDTPSQPYVPIRAAMALVKIGCSLAPTNILPQCAPAIDWLMGRLCVNISKFPVLYAFTPGPNPYGTGKAMLLRRKTDDPIPYLWCIVATANYRFQFFLPFCPNDGWISNGGESTLTTRQFPVPFGEDWPYGPTEYGVFDWAGDIPVVKKPQVTFNVGHAELVAPPSEEGNTTAEPQSMPIETLYPYECSVIASRVAQLVAMIQSNEVIDPVTVIEIDGCWLVRNGAHRVAAAKECGLSEVPVIIRPVGKSEFQPFKDALASAMKRNRLGFENLPRDKNQEERSERTRQELYEDHGMTL